MSRVRQLLARRDGLAQLAVVLGAFAAYEAARLAMKPNWAQSFENANRIQYVEQALGFAWEQSLQRAFLALPNLVAALNLFYFIGHFLFTAIFFFWLYHRSRDGFRSFRDGFLAATAIAVVIHWLYPPRHRDLPVSVSRTHCCCCPGSISVRPTRLRSRIPSPLCRPSMLRMRSGSGSG